MPLATRYAIIAILATAMGIQNATARRLSVPDLTTTVLTLTLTGIGADSRLGSGTGEHLTRRIIAVATMFVGALGGALLVVHVDIVTPLVLATALLAVTSLGAHAWARRDTSWSRTSTVGRVPPSPTEL